MDIKILASSKQGLTKLDAVLGKLREARSEVQQHRIALQR